MATIKFTEGISRFENSSQNTCSDLRNGRIVQFGEMEAHFEPTDVTSGYNGKNTPSATSYKPWTYWNGRWVTSEDSDSGSMKAVARHSSLLYTSNGVDEIKVFKDDYDGNADTVETEPAYVTSNPLTNTANASITGIAPGGLEPGHYVTYLVIPCNDRDEAGPWYYDWYLHDSTETNNGGVRLFLDVNDACSYVEVYRTRERGEDSGAEEDNVFYYIGRYHASDQGRVSISDPNGYHQKDRDDLKEQITKDNLRTLDRAINAHEYTFDGSTYKSPAARAMHNEAGTMFYADVTWPTKFPQLSYRVTGTGARIAVQYEYSTAEGTVYGPLFEVNGIADVQRLEVAYQGEQALLVYEYDSGNSQYQLLERQTPNMYGRYVTNLPDDDALNLTFHSDYSAKGGNETTDPSFTPKSANSDVRENNVVLMSERNRPWEVLLEEQFSMPDETTVKTITSARLAEEEALREYTFYVFTDNGLFTGRLQGRNPRTWKDFQRIGMEQSNFNNQPIYALVPRGVAFYATDGQIYVISGRQMKQIDRNMQDLWAEVHDMTFNQQKNELWVLTNSGIWIYSFEFNQWIGEYDYEDTGTTQTATIDIEFADSNSALITSVTGDSFDPEDRGSYITLEVGGTIQAEGVVSANDRDAAIWFFYSDLDTLTGLDATWYNTSKGRVIHYWENEDEIIAENISGTNQIEMFNDDSDTYLEARVSTQPLAEGSVQNGVQSIQVDFIPTDDQTPKVRHVAQTFGVTNGSSTPPEYSYSWEEQRFDLPPNRPRYTRLKGFGNIITVTGFKRMKSIDVELQES